MTLWLVVAVLLTPVWLAGLNAVLAILLQMQSDFVTDVVYGYLWPVRAVRKGVAFWRRLLQEIRNQWKED